jgi:hypothetical protein
MESKVAIATTTNMRELAGWTTAVTDARLTPHLNSAARELKTWLGADIYEQVSDDDGDDFANAAEVEACLAIAYALPSLMTFAIADGPTVPKDVEEIGFQFLTPDQVNTAVEVWKSRAERVYRGWEWPAVDDEGEATTKTPIGMHAV